jgi:hypothetical protein
MSHRNTPISERHTLIVDGNITDIPARDADVIKTLNWDKYINNIYQRDTFREVERSHEYF